MKFPQLYDLVVVIDPTISEWSVTYNPLEIVSQDQAKLKAQNLADTITTVYKDDPQQVVRMYRVAYYSFLTLALAGRSLVDMPELLSNRVFREEIVRSLTDPDVLRFWLSEFPRDNNNDARTRVESTLNRVDRIVQSPIAPMLSGRGSLDLRDLIDRGCFVIVRAPEGALGTDAAYLLPALLISDFKQAALSRQDIHPSKRRPFTLFADEFTVYLTSAIPQIINQVSKYRLELFLSTQQVEAHLNTRELMGAVVGSVGSIFCLRISYDDAVALVHQLSTPDFDQKKYSQWRDWQEQITWRSMDEIWQREIRKIITLPKRQLWWREAGSLETRYIHTIDIDDVEKLSDAHLLSEARAKLFDAVRTRYGKLNPRRSEGSTGYSHLLPDLPDED